MSGIWHSKLLSLEDAERILLRSIVHEGFRHFAPLLCQGGHSFGLIDRKVTLLGSIVGLAQRFIPGPRILTVNKFEEDPQYLWVSYGHLSFRLKPILWREVDYPGFNLGDLVEVSKLYSPREPSMATIEEITWDQTDECIKFQLSRRGKMIPGLFTAHQFSLSNRIPEK